MVGRLVLKPPSGALGTTRPTTAGQVFETYTKNELAADKDIQIAADDSREVRELKQIVNGMREEMRGYLANGNGTPRSFWRRLNERTLFEMQIYNHNQAYDNALSYTTSTVAGTKNA